MIRRLLLTAAAGLLLTACDTGAPQASLNAEERAELEALVGEYLDGAEQQLASDMVRAPGFSDEITNLQPGADHSFALTLEGGTAYRIIGACDNECEDMNMELTDASGAVVASDMLEDDFPLVDVTPPTTGAYTARLIMVTCTIAPCYAGARVMTAAPVPASAPVAETPAPEAAPEATPAPAQ